MTLTDDVVSRVARSILVAIRTSNVERDALAWELTDEELAQIARAALEAARWGEMRECLRDCADDLAAELTDRYFQAGEMHPALKSKYDRDMAPVVKARALLTIGESNLKGDRG